MTDLDDLPWSDGSTPTRNGATGRKPGRNPNPDPVTVRRGRNNRSRGNRAELAVARRYGGEKTGPLGQPEDIRGTDWRTQVKTHQGLPPARWRKVFAALDTQHDGRLPRLIERYLPGQGIAADDYIVVRGADWLAWFGRDE